jgi:AmmeMemoRadiSam system protein A
MTAVVAPPATVPDVDLSTAEEDDLLDLARFAVRAATRGQQALARHAAVERLGGRPATIRRLGAAFVTLLEHGELRGCIGILDATRPLAVSVAGAAIGAAMHDWRFGPVTEDELPSIEVQVSVLGPCVPLDDPMTFRPGIDGLLVERGFERGLLLPEVATENGFDREAMLRATCGKAGLSADAWRDRATHVSAFRTRRFGGPALA